MLKHELITELERCELLGLKVEGGVSDEKASAYYSVLSGISVDQFRKAIDTHTAQSDARFQPKLPAAAKIRALCGESGSFGETGLGMTHEAWRKTVRVKAGVGLVPVRIEGTMMFEKASDCVYDVKNRRYHRRIDMLVKYCPEGLKDAQAKLLQTETSSEAQNGLTSLNLSPKRYKTYLNTLEVIWDEFGREKCKSISGLDVVNVSQETMPYMPGSAHLSQMVVPEDSPSHWQEEA